MADVKWIKIVTDVFDDEKILMIESLPEADSIIVIWFKLLCLAGKQNNSGVFILGRMPYTDEMFATVFRRPINTVRLALKTFVDYGMIEIINNTVTIPNWDKHQSLDAYEKRKERDRLYQAERRAAQKAIAEKSADSSADASSDIASQIRRDKKKTRTAVIIIIPTGATIFQLILIPLANTITPNITNITSIALICDCLYKKKAATAINPKGTKYPFQLFINF
jgi:predicted phage replisome organizer